MTIGRTAAADIAGTTQARGLGRHRLGADLRRLRQARSLRIEDVAARLELAPSTLSRMETGQAPVKAAYLTIMLDLYRVHDPAQRARLTDLARDSMRKGWHDRYRYLLPAGASRYLDLETAATHLRSYSVQAVPGLAQTPGYAAAAICAAGLGFTRRRVRDLVTLQDRRQEHARSARRRLHLILDQSALLRPIGTAKIMAAQLSHLLTLATDPAITLQVAELSRPSPVLTLPFTILTLPAAAGSGAPGPDAVCTAGIGGQISITTCNSDLRTMRAIFTALAGNAASTDDTAILIKDAAAHWERQAHQDFAGERQC